MRLLYIAAILSGLLTGSACLSGSLLAASQEDAQFFETKIRPVLVKQCYQCHSANSKIIQGGLRLDHRAGLLKGGDSGPAVVPGNAAGSVLVSALKYDGVEMPPSGKLAPNVIADFEKWIANGAHDPRQETTAAAQLTPPTLEAAKTHWAFQPVHRLNPPQVQHSAWVSNPIDNFVAAKFEAAGLSPANPASKARLIRRATFDLIGLPPTPEEVAAFEADKSPGAFSKVVERLLASPQYGERWGRHWLDLARYADTNGGDENHSFPNAWRYRDYVIRAFNNDLPYNVFIQQQLAGDLLPPASNEAEKVDQIAATSFLVIGPKNLAEQDKPKMISDIVDEQIDTVGRTFLGLTTGCARCHDHKFDPIPTSDYYALAGIFSSTKTMANVDFVSQWQERDLPSAEFERATVAHKQQIEAERAQLHKLEVAGDSKLSPAQRKLKNAERRKLYSPELQKLVETALKNLEFLKTHFPERPRAMAVTEGAIQDVPIHIRGNHLTLAAEKTPRGVIQATQWALPAPKISPAHSGRLELANWLVSPQHPLTARVMANRIWQKHFGRGIVASASNFGLKGDAPTNPELLDWLASEFMAQNWSIKHLHRMIMLSSTYAMSVEADTVAERKDPSNLLLSHQNRRRLEAEAIRDSICAVAGVLDPKQGGVEHYARSPRRSIYQFINRSAVNDMFATFDYYDASSHVDERSNTTVPQQALFMLNSLLVEQHAQLLANNKVLWLPGATDADRVQQLYQRLYARAAKPAEVTRALNRLEKLQPQLASLPEVQRRAASWAWLCRTLIAGNEFLFID